MPRYTTAYSKFIIRLSEVEILLNLARHTSKKAPVPKNLELINTLCRSGVVMLSSHIEGFIEDLGEIIFDQIIQRRLPKSQLSLSFRYYLSHDLIAEIKQTSEPSSLASKIDNLWRRDDHIWNSSPHFTNSISARQFVHGFANPDHDAILKFFRRFGYDQCQRDLARRLRANFSACSNMVNQVVAQRNRIAHGDISATGSPSDLADMIQLVKPYCRELDCVVADWFKSKGCPIM